MEKSLNAAAGTGYLMKSSGISWVDCKAQTPETHEDVNDYEYLEVGNHYWEEPTVLHWEIGRPFLRYAIPDFHTQDGVAAATLRLHVHSSDFANGGEFRLYLLGSTYGSLDAADWDLWDSQEYVTFSYSDIDADDYFDITLSDAQLGLLAGGANADFVVREKNDITGGDPSVVGSKWFKAYAPGAENIALVPVLTLTLYSGREKIERALITTLGIINEADGYSTTPALVTRDRVDFGDIAEPSLPALCVLSDDEVRELLPAEIAECSWAIYVLGVMWYTEGQTPGEMLNRLVSDVDRVLGSNPTLGLSGAICQRAWLKQVDGNPGNLTKDHRAYCLFHIEAKHTRFLNA